MRIHLAKLMRQLRTIVEENITDIERIKSMLNELKVNSETDDVLANGRLDKLIRENLIDRQMASSLMNDSAYAYELNDSIVEAAEIVFAQFSSLQKELSLVDAELEEALEQSQTEIDLLLKKKTKEIDDIRLKEKPATQ